MKIKVMKEELVRFDVTNHTQGVFDVLAFIVRGNPESR